MDFKHSKSWLRGSLACLFYLGFIQGELYILGAVHTHVRAWAFLVNKACTTRHILPAFYCADNLGYLTIEVVQDLCYSSFE